MACHSQPDESKGYSIRNTIAFILLACGLAGCATLPDDQRTELDALAEFNLQSMEKAYPELGGKLEASKGYLAMDARCVKIPFIGWGGGKGVVVDTTTGERTYVKVSRMDIGGGGGIREFDVVIVLYDEKFLRQAKAGKWIYGVGAEASAGSASKEGSSGTRQTDKPFELFVRSERGASVTWTLHTVRIKPYKD